MNSTSPVIASTLTATPAPMPPAAALEMPLWLESVTLALWKCEEVGMAVSVEVEVEVGATEIF